MARARSWRSSASLGTPRACTLIAQRCRADVQRRRLGRTRTTGFRPLGERMAANRHGMRPRGRDGRPASRKECLAIARPSQAMIAAEWARAQRAVMGTSGVGGTGGLGVATLVAAAMGRAGRAAGSDPTHAQAHAQAHSGALRQHSQAALKQQSGSTHEQSLAIRTTRSPHAVAPRRRPRRGRCCCFCH